MKKLAICTLFIASTGILLSACSTGDTKSTTVSSSIEFTKESSEEKMTESTNEAHQTRSEFTAVLIEDAVENGDAQDTIRLVLQKVAAVEDPENILPMMQNDGVILNVTKKQLSEDLTDLKKGTEVRFVLTGLPVMTMSIPPQIPGNSVEQVTINK